MNNFKCPTCEDKGYIEHSRAGSGAFQSNLQVCPECKNYAKYNEKIKELYSRNDTESLLAELRKKEQIVNTSIKLVPEIPEVRDNVIFVDFTKKNK